ncbi:MAG TPA: SUMF1/EgtB/PvdO family nonheme iron enzyme [Terriglobia bacterium]|nr:SUMF1/EgtB/PvdO family nonheme iron enzyme [Terriglobia bacterium]
MSPYSQIVILSLLVGVGGEAHSEDNLRSFSATSYEITDSITGLKVKVKLSGFALSRTEITQREFSAVMNYNPSFHAGEEYPVENVSWWETIRYCNLRSLKEGLLPCYNLATGECDFSRNGYRLPTDAEWSYAYGEHPCYDSQTLHQYCNIGSTNTQSLSMLSNALRETGTRKVGSYPPNASGLYDMLGNVWEWCHDYHTPVSNAPSSLTDPSGPSHGVARIVRGGSFISTVTSWNEKKAYRSSLSPDYRSRFTGFRVCRSLKPPEKKQPQMDETEWFVPFNRAPQGFTDTRGNLASLLVTLQGEIISSVPQWSKQRAALKEKWAKLLGSPSIKPPEPRVQTIETFKEDCYTGKLMYLQVEPDFWEKMLLMLPDKPLTQPTPVVIVPYYDVDTPAGKNLGGRSFTPMSVRSFAYFMVQRGYIAVAIRWFGESYGESYDEAVSNLILRHPGCSGLGKWVWDSQRLVDYLYSLPEVDHRQIGIIGHSLGAKMALYAAAMDERITVAVFSEGGIGFSFSNYDDYWYFSDAIHTWDKSIDQHELLGLIAPRPFLLIGGDEYDTSKSWYYINAAREVYRLLGRPRNIGYFNHHNGHTPTTEAVERSIDWLDHFLTMGPSTRWN